MHHQSSAPGLAACFLPQQLAVCSRGLAATSQHNEALQRQAQQRAGDKDRLITVMLRSVEEAQARWGGGWGGGAECGVGAARWTADGVLGPDPVQLPVLCYICQSAHILSFKQTRTAQGRDY